MMHVTVELISTFRDGGTKHYKELNSNTEYYVDGRIGSKTQGAIFTDHPSREGAKRLYNIVLKEADGKIVAVSYDEVNSENPHNLEIGKQYWFRHIPSNGRWYLATITRFTKDGYPWQHNKGIDGIVSGEYYEVRPYYQIPVEELKSIYMKGLSIVNAMNDQELMDFVNNNSHLIKQS